MVAKMWSRYFVLYILFVSGIPICIKVAKRSRILQISVNIKKCLCFLLIIMLIHSY